MKKSGMIACALALAGCATGTTVPSKRPLTVASMHAIGHIDVVVNETQDGLAQSWIKEDYANVAATGYGPLGEVVGSIADVIINAGPARRARKSANAIADHVSASDLDSSLVTHLKALIAAADAPQSTRISIRSVTTRQRILAPRTPENAVEITTTYAVSVDASEIRIDASAAFLSPSLHYVSPYLLKGSAPKSRCTGPVYLNRFTYYSNKIRTPEISPELQQYLVNAIEETYQDESGAPPLVDSKDFKAMTKDLEHARDGNFSEVEVAFLRRREWLKNDAAALKTEVEKAHAFIAKYLVLDLNNPTVPSLNDQDELLESLDDERSVKRLGLGERSGSYESSVGALDSHADYGNAITISSIQALRLAQLRKEASNARAAIGAPQ